MTIHDCQRYLRDCAAVYIERKEVELYPFTDISNKRILTSKVCWV